MSFRIEVVRTEFTEDWTAGKVLFDGAPSGYTLERPWLDNRQFVSCVPEGDYPIRIRNGAKEKSGRFPGLHFWVDDVPGRYSILIHSGNRVDETTGCILVGFSRGPGFVGSSRACLNELVLLAAARGRTGRLRISAIRP